MSFSQALRSCHSEGGTMPMFGPNKYMAFWAFQEWRFQPPCLSLSSSA